MLGHCTLLTTNKVKRSKLLSAVSKLIDSLNIREMVADKYSYRKGRPSLDPESYFRMQVLMHLFGIRSERFLCQEVYLNDTYRDFCHFFESQEIPHHSTLTKTRNRLGPIFFFEIFEKLNLLFAQNNMIEYQIILVDSTLIDADASMKKMIARNDSKLEEPTNSKKKRKKRLVTKHTLVKPTQTLL